MINRTNNGLYLIGLDTPEGWVGSFNENYNILAKYNTVGACAVTARDVDPASLLPTSRYFQVPEGVVVWGNSVYRQEMHINQLAPPSVVTYVWFDAYVILRQGAQFPTDRAYIPLAEITTDADRITEIVDYRNPIQSIGGPISFSRKVITANYTQEFGVNHIRIDATAGPIALTLALPDWNQGCLTILRRIDATANAVIVNAEEWEIGYPTLIDGAVTMNMTGVGSVVLSAVQYAYEIVF